MFDRARRRLPALPSAHFMAFAPLDCWWRLLRRPGARVPPRFWPRLAWCLFTSGLATLLTLPERIALWPFLRILHARAERPSSSRTTTAAPPLRILFILGYYRSGTTHLHYLLSCDPRAATPRWYHVLAPTGYVLSWTLIRWLLVPFLSSRRPQDDVSFGPEWPSEEDFALGNWTGACTMPGRMVFPAAASWAHYRRYQTLDGLVPRERRLFRRTFRAFVWKLAPRRAGAHLLLKSPANTARLAELCALFPRAELRFIHLSRDPLPVLRSNLAMHRRFAPFFLQEQPGDAEVRARVIDEYDATERAFLRDLAALPDCGAGVVSLIRYQDLIADPLGQVRRAYAELGLEFSDDFQRRAAAYLAGVADYRSAADKPAGGSSSPGPDDAGLPEQLAWMRERFGHTRPPVDPAPPAIPMASPAAEPVMAFAAAVCAACAAAAIWLTLAFLARDRMDWLTWPTGVLIGIAAVRVARVGSLTLGLVCGALTLGVLLAVAVPATLFTGDYRHTLSPSADIPWDHVALSVRRGLTAENNLVWIILGVMTAYRVASRRHIRPPGMT